MTTSTWFTTANGSLVNWSTAVVNGVAQADIFEVDVVSPDGFPQVTLWAHAGTAVAGGQIAAAQSLASTGNPPAVRPGEAVKSGGSMPTVTVDMSPVVGAVQAETTATQAGTAAVQAGTVATQSVASAVQALTAQELASLGASGAQRITSTRSAFRDGFTTGTAQQPVDPTVWTLRNEAPDSGNGQGHIVLPSGDSMGAGYLRVSLSPFSPGTSVHLASVGKYAIPFRHAWGLSMSQRFTGQEVIYGLAEALDSDLPSQSNPGGLGLNRIAQPADLAISGSVTTSGSTATITIPLHGLKGGDRVILLGNATRQLDVGPVFVTVVDANTITVPSSLAAGTYPAGGIVRVADPAGLANNAAQVNLGDTTTVTAGSYVSRRSGGKYRTATGQGMPSSNPTQNNPSPYTDAMIAGAVSEIWANIDEVVWRNWTEGNSGMTGYAKFAQSIPDETLQYRLYCRAKNLDNLTRPIARITSAARSGTTTATITTDVAHNLSVGDRVAIQGVRDQTDFGGTADLAVASVVNSTSFTVVFGSTATVTDTSGGVVWLNRGGITGPGVVTNGNVQSIASTTTGVLAITLQSTVGGVSVGDYVNLYGLLGSAAPYEGAYKVMRLNGSVLEVAFTGALFGSINTGGQVIRRTDVRLHFARILDYNRLFAEIVGGRGNAADNNNAVPTTVVGGQVSLNQGAQLGVTRLLTGWTTSALAAGGTYASGATDRSSTTVNRYTRSRFVYQATAAALGSVAQVTLQESSDNVTYRETQRLTLPADGQAHTWEWAHRLEFYKVSVFNGGTAQTALYLTSEGYAGDGESTDIDANLPIPLTPLAGTPLAASATFASPTIDLGYNHQWDRLRLFAIADQVSAGSGLRIQASFDNSAWADLASTTIAAAGPGYPLEAEVGPCRYYRVIVVNSTTAMTALRVGCSLVTL